MVDSPADEQQTVPLSRGTLASTAPDSSQGPQRVDALTAPARSLDFATRYEEERELGRGGMGTVTLCHDRQTGRHVAMKMVSPEHRQRDHVVRRFLREARLQAQLEHPSVVPVYELAPTPDGHAYFTMKRVRGITLRHLLERLRDRDPEAVDVHTLRRRLVDLGRVCLAIDYAHRAGVVHRDIKPDNLMLGDYGEVYVLDWGIALPLPSEPQRPKVPGEQPEVPSSIMGTAGYAAPEQILDGDEVDGRADVYSLGCVLFELLTLEPPHRGNARERLASTLEHEAPLASERAPHLELAPELDRICARALARDPARRYGSARELYGELERFLDGERDQQLRRTLATEHAERAEQAADRLHEGVHSGREAIEARREALREVGRALALDPNNDSATHTMVRLLTQPPEATPDEVRKRLRGAAIDRIRAGGRAAAVIYFGLLLYLPFIWWAGIVDGFAVAVVMGLGVVAGAVSLQAGIGHSAHHALVATAMLVSMVAMSVTATLFGPLVLTPGILAVNGTAYAITVGRRLRRVTALVGLLALVIPLGLEGLGIVSPSYRLGPEGMTILPRAIALDGYAGVALLAIASVGTVITGIVAVGRLRDALDRAERQLELYSWHFQQLLPDGDRGTTG